MQSHHRMKGSPAIPGLPDPDPRLLARRPAAWGGSGFARQGLGSTVVAAERSPLGEVAAREGLSVLSLRAPFFKN